MDGSLIKIAIAIILPKDKVADMQIDILKNISVKLLDKEFVKTIKETDSKS
jgi:mannitol/fructose-specific phosphotransferase system IIA component (Ntr-type)